MKKRHKLRRVGKEKNGGSGIKIQVGRSGAAVHARGVEQGGDREYLFISFF